MDVWFDSGSSWAGTLLERGIQYPADLYLEGSDQYRGWFNSSLIVSLASMGKAPYKTVVSHGWVLDEHGEQMHKSKGNGVDPTKIANVYGSDILRLWVATVDYQQDVRIGENLIKQVSEQYRKVRNTLKFISWNLVDYDPNNKEVSYEKEDLYILNKLHQVVNNTIAFFDKYDFASAMSEIMTFMSADLSSFYLDIAKDVLYCDGKDSIRRKTMQSVLFEIGDTLLRVLNPVLPFTMDELNKNLPGKRKENVQYLDYPTVKPVDDNVLEEYEVFKSLRTDVLKALEDARANKVIGSAQEAFVAVKFNDNNSPEAKLFAELDPKHAASLFVVSEIRALDNSSNDYELAKIEVKHHTGHFCERCWNYEDDAEIQEDGTYLCKRCAKVVK